MARKTYQTCSGTTITGEVYMEGPRGVVFVTQRPDPESQYPDNRGGYAEVYLFERPYSERIAERHSHGYSVTGSWNEYFRTLVG